MSGVALGQVPTSCKVQSPFSKQGLQGVGISCPLPCVRLSEPCARLPELLLPVKNAAWEAYLTWQQRQGRPKATSAATLRGCLSSCSPGQLHPALGWHPLIDRSMLFGSGGLQGGHPCLAHRQQ